MTHKILQNQSLLSAPLARHFATLDNRNPRMTERVNTVLFLEGLAKRILPSVALQLFKASKKEKCEPHYYVQAPVGCPDDAKLHLTALRLGSAGKASINRKPVPVIVRSAKKRPITPAKVTPSAKKARSSGIQNDDLYFVDAIATTTCESPTKPIETIDLCRNNVVAGFGRKSRIFFTSLRAYRERLQQSPSVTIDSVTDAVTAVKKAYLYIGGETIAQGVFLVASHESDEGW